MKKLLLMAVAIVGLTFSSGCTAAEMKEDAAIVESEVHSLAVDAEAGLDALDANAPTIDAFEEIVIAPLAAQSAALKKANDEFLALWNAYKAGKIGPSGSPVTKAELKVALAAIEALSSAKPAVALTARRKQRQAAAAARPPKKPAEKPADSGSPK